MLLTLFNFYHVERLLMFYNKKILPMIGSDQQRITQHKRFALRAHPNFCFAKTYFMLGTLRDILLSDLFGSKRNKIELGKIGG